MNRRAFLASTGVLAGCARDTRPRLNVFNWSTYIAPETVPNFEREYGCRVRYGIYESNEEMLARVLSGNSGWDIVFPSGYLLKPMLAQSLVAPLPPIPGLANLDPVYSHPDWDPTQQWSVPYMAGAAGIAYNRKLTKPPEAWASLWSPRMKGRITMLDDPFDVMGACLKKIGDSINATSRAQLMAAQAQAIAQKPLLRAYLNAEARDQVVSGDLLAAQMWNTTAQQAADASPDIGFVYPEEGYAVYVDCMVILRESKHQDLAQKFIEFMLRPQVAAANALAARTTTTNAAARAHFPEAFRTNQTLYPPPEILGRGEWAQTVSPDSQRLRDRLWTEIKSA